MGVYREKLGIVGGFGAYATLNFYRRILEVFASKSERNYPHIVMDNNFTMPSRTRALLFDEDYDDVVLGIAESMKLMLQQKVDKIVLVCGTAHYFLEDVYKIVPEAKGKVLDIIEVLGNELENKKKTDALVMAAEGALLKELYPAKLGKYGVSCISPPREYYDEIRFYIESVKQNKLNKDVAIRFVKFINSFSSNNIILGCTEFPILVEYIQNKCMHEEIEKDWEKLCFFDPLEMVINHLKHTLV